MKAIKYLLLGIALVGSALTYSPNSSASDNANPLTMCEAAKKKLPAKVTVRAIYMTDFHELGILHDPSCPKSSADMLEADDIVQDDSYQSFEESLSHNPMDIETRSVRLVVTGTLRHDKYKHLQLEVSRVVEVEKIGKPPTPGVEFK